MAAAQCVKMWRRWLTSDWDSEGQTVLKWWLSTFFFLFYSFLSFFLFVDRLGLGNIEGKCSCPDSQCCHVFHCFLFCVHYAFNESHLLWPCNQAHLLLISSLPREPAITVMVWGLMYTLWYYGGGGCQCQALIIKSLPFFIIVSI